jgi:hypothetical protein
VTLDQIIYVITVGHRLVPATGTMVMTGLMAVTMVLRRAAFRILSPNFQGMFLDDG